MGIGRQLHVAANRAFDIQHSRNRQEQHNSLASNTYHHRCAQVFPSIRSKMYKIYKCYTRIVTQLPLICEHIRPQRAYRLGTNETISNMNKTRATRIRYFQTFEAPIVRSIDEHNPLLACDIHRVRI